jgi:hypothetical protein
MSTSTLTSTTVVEQPVGPRELGIWKNGRSQEDADQVEEQEDQLSSLSFGPNALTGTSAVLLAQILVASCVLLS